MELAHSGRGRKLRQVKRFGQMFLEMRHGTPQLVAGQRGLPPLLTRAGGVVADQMHGKALRHPLDIELATLAFRHKLMMDELQKVGQLLVSPTGDIAQGWRCYAAENIAGYALEQGD